MLMIARISLHAYVLYILCVNVQYLPLLLSLSLIVFFVDFSSDSSSLEEEEEELLFVCFDELKNLL